MDLKRSVFNQEEEAAQRDKFSHGNASRIDDLWVFQVMVSDPDESVLDLDEILMVDFEHGTVQSFNTRWDETMMAMKKHTEEEMLDFFWLLASSVRTAQAVAQTTQENWISLELHQVPEDRSPGRARKRH